jgi:chemotaxis signal transduction protein
MRVDSTTITAPGPMVHGLAAAYISGIVTKPSRTIIILNARKLLSPTERMALTGIGGDR